MCHHIISDVCSSVSSVNGNERVINPTVYSTEAASIVRRKHFECDRGVEVLELLLCWRWLY